MEILYVAAESSNWVINLCNNFCELGHRVTVVTQNLDEYDKENPIKIHPDIRRINLDLKTLITPTLLLPELEKEVSKHPYDIIFGSHAPVCPAVIATAKRHNLKSGIMLLDIPTDLIKVQQERNFQWKFWFSYLKHANLIITNTHIARDEFAKFTGKMFDDSNVITYAINMLDSFDKISIDKKGSSVISVCRLTPMKNCLLIPKALKLLDLNLKYVAIGRDGGQLQEIKDYCKENNIKFKHFNMVSEQKKFELISKSSMLIYPQRTPYIGGLSPFEAMFVGIPALVPRLKVLVDLFGENAFYFNNNNEIELANIIAILHGYKRNILKQRLLFANNYVKEEANFMNMAKKLIKKMEEVIK